MSSIINVYAPDAEDFDCEGLGTLCPLEWEYNNKGIGGAILTITHPQDPDGKWRLIQAGRIIRADVPVRTVPEIESGALIATAEQWRVGVAATKSQRTMYSKAVNGKKKKAVPAGRTVTVVAKGESRYKIKASKYGTGWIDHNALEVKIQDVPYNTVAAVEAATPSVQVRAQLFRLQQPKVEKDGRTITVEALPIAYDAAGILTDAWSGSVLTGPQALALITEHAYIDTDLELYTNIGDSRTGFEKRNVGIIDALLNGDESFVGRWGGDVLIDDNTITILRSAGVDRGYYATYGRNLVGIDSYEISDDIVTAIVPVGENANGAPLYLDGQKYVTSPNYSQFPVPHMTELKVSEAKVDKKERVTPAKARQAMRDAVAAEWEKGVHIPAITLRIEFARLGDSEEYRQFRDIDQCHMYDIVHVWHPTVCGYVDMAVCEITWDGMRGRYSETVLGTPGGTLSTARISAGSISGSISGRQIAWNTIGAGQLADECIDARHIQADSINAEAIQTNTLTADTAVVQTLNARAIDATAAKIGSITSTSIRTDALAAAFASLFTVVADNISARTITVDALDAVIESVVTLTAGSANFDVNTVRHLVSSVLSVTHLIGGMARIENLYVTNANLVNATLDALTVKGSDDNYYDIAVGSDGVLSATLREVSQAEIDAGETTDGRGIVGDIDLDVVGEDGIDGKYLRDAETGLMTLYASALSAGHITATTAFIGSGRIPSLETTAVKALGDSIDISANESILMQTGDDTKGLRRVLRLDSDGLHVGKSDSLNEVLIDDSTVNITQRGSTPYSVFGRNYVQFGNYQLRRSADGGLAFKMI